MKTKSLTSKQYVIIVHLFWFCIALVSHLAIKSPHALRSNYDFSIAPSQISDLTK